ncbi:DNA-3-methyladenine glycosylase family protein [Alkalithermobacter paradoxus]|uniref:DNA-3-methyladenine glycosylase II n=1 Tax=Alkalithermobacter paradoxus TaxID=29349 RepID=A0A1V4IBD5_9FIRM|nr:DNA-3-methyladenine glycosylase [[Clostridium] thermoalcaliphilum]
MRKTLQFNKNDKESIYISSIDEKMSKLIERVNECKVVLADDYYLSLIKSIIGQQLSLKAADTIYNRFIELCEYVTPEKITSLKDEELRSIGLSRSKIIYMKDLSNNVINKCIDLNEIDNYEDEEIIKILTKVKGIGKWTAQMFLIFSLGRLDIFSPQDLGLKKGIKWLYDLNEIPSEKETMHMSEKFSPYRTVLSLYLWEASNKGLLGG